MQSDSHQACSAPSTSRRLFCSIELMCSTMMCNCVLLCTIFGAQPRLTLAVCTCRKASVRRRRACCGATTRRDGLRSNFWRWKHKASMSVVPDATRSPFRLRASSPSCQLSAPSTKRLLFIFRRCSQTRADAIGWCCCCVVARTSWWPCAAMTEVLLLLSLLPVVLLLVVPSLVVQCKTEKKSRKRSNSSSQDFNPQPSKEADVSCTPIALHRC